MELQRLIRINRALKQIHVTYEDSFQLSSMASTTIFKLLRITSEFLKLELEN